MDKKRPLGIIRLETGEKKIYPTNDFFLNYMFENPASWEALRIIINILIGKYKKLVPQTQVNTIECEIKVATQYNYYTKNSPKPKSQDFKVFDDFKNLVFVEVQNRANSKPPIVNRAIEYFGLSLGHNSNKDITQMWIMGEDIEVLQQEEQFINYIMSDEKTGKRYPLNNNLMFVSLKKLAEEKCEAGELAKFLLGENVSQKNEDIRRVIKIFGEGFDTFIEDKEAIEHMTVLDRYKAEGREEGVEIGLEMSLNIMRAIKEAMTDAEISQRFDVPVSQIAKFRASL